MEFRPGTCSACKASFRIPASFTANKAKCSKCGGTVEIGPVTSDGPGAQKSPSSAAPAKSVSAPVADAAARLALRPEAVAAPVPARSVPASVPAKPPLAGKPSAAASAASHAPTRPLAKPPTPAPAPKSSAPKAAATAGKDDDETGRSSRRTRAERKKSGPNPMFVIGSLGLCAVIGVAAFWAYNNDKQDQKRREEKAAEVKAEQLELARIEQAKLDKAVAPEQQPGAESGSGDSAAAPADATLGAASPDASAAASTPQKTGDAAKGGVGIPGGDAKPAAPSKPVEGFDLSTIPDFGPAEGTTPEQWVELQALAETWVDYSAGARAKRAGVKLEETPKQSFPAILNVFKKQNLEDEAGFRNADATAKMLERICRGNNVGWKYQNEKDWLQYDQKAIKAWCDLWTKASADPAFWDTLIKKGVPPKSDPDAEGGDKPPPKKPDDF